MHVLAQEYNNGYAITKWRENVEEHRRDCIAYSSIFPNWTCEGPINTKIYEILTKQEAVLFTLDREMQKLARTIVKQTVMEICAVLALPEGND